MQAFSALFLVLFLFVADHCLESGLHHLSGLVELVRLVRKELCVRDSQELPRIQLLLPQTPFITVNAQNHFALGIQRLKRVWNPFLPLSVPAFALITFASVFMKSSLDSTVN